MKKRTFTIDGDTLRVIADLAHAVLHSRQNVGTRLKDLAGSVWRAAEAVKTDPGTPGMTASIADGVWFQAAASGLWYRSPGAAGSVTAILVNGAQFKPGNVTLADIRPDDGGAPWCEACRSYHSVPQNDGHHQALQCKAPFDEAGDAPGREWFVVDRDKPAGNGYLKLRGPYATAQAAGAVRGEMERDPDEERNLWIVYEDKPLGIAVEETGLTVTRNEDGSALAKGLA